MKKKIKLIWKKREGEFGGFTFHQSFVGHIEVNYKIAVCDNGDVALGVLRTNADIVKSHPSQIPIYPNFTEDSIYDFIPIYDKTKMTFTAGKKPNSGILNGFEVEIPKFEIAKQMAQDMFNEEVKYFRKMMKICEE